MKERLADSVIRTINAVAFETGVAPRILEKDVYVTEILQMFSTLVIPDSIPLRLVFCGGTCLSKAHKAIDRMSEDVDFKLIATQALSRNALKAKLSAFRNEILFPALQGAGFDIVVKRDRDAEGNADVRNEGRYIRLDLAYHSAFEEVESLRGHLLVELTYAALQKPSAQMSFGSIIDEIAQSANRVTFDCIDLSETVAEKVVSFSRRLGMHWRGHERGEFDKSLVRHLYDIYVTCVRQPLPVDLAELKRMVSTIIAMDVAQYRTQYPEYAADAIAETHAVLDMFERDATTYRQLYDKFVEDMVFEESSPSFQDAFRHYLALARNCLSI